MPQSYVASYFHLVFSTKSREPLIHKTMQSRLYEYVGGILRSDESILLEAGGMADHVHLLVSLSKKVAVADALRTIKANSSKWIHEKFPKQRGFAWQSGYGAFSVSYSNLGRVRRYIADQPEHHRVRSFQEEFLGFLRRHGVEYDPRYVWE